MAYLHWATCHNIKSSKYLNSMPRLFQNNNNNNNLNNEILRHVVTHHLSSIVTKIVAS
jgi:hypothetical protein